MCLVAPQAAAPPLAQHPGQAQTRRALAEALAAVDALDVDADLVRAPDQSTAAKWTESEAPLSRVVALQQVVLDHCGRRGPTGTRCSTVFPSPTR